MLFLVICMAFTYTSSHASVGPPTDTKSVKRELKNTPQEVNSIMIIVHGCQVTNVNDIVQQQECYAQEVYTHCGTFQYDACFDHVPSMEELLAYVDAMDFYFNYMCT